MQNLIITVLRLASFLFIGRALLSWFPIDERSAIYPIARGIHQITEPVLAPIRSVMPRTGGFDFSILVAIFGINLLLIPLARNLL
jgi:YggT family protein